MKQNELKPCSACGEGLARDKILTFFKVTIDQMVIDVNAVRQQAGLEMMLGNPVIAFHIGPQADLAHPLNHYEHLICCHCALRCSIAELTEDYERRQRHDRNSG